MTISVKQNNTYAAATGVWVKVNGVWKQVATSGLEGLGGWAEITEVTGSPKRYAYNDGGTDWVAFEWTLPVGSVTTDKGVVECLVVAGGGGSSGPYTGGGGGMLQQIVLIEDDNHDIIVGAGGAATKRGGNSRFATVETVGGGGAMATDSTPAQRPGGSGGGGTTGGGAGIGVPGQGHDGFGSYGGGAGGSGLGAGQDPEFGPPRASSIADGTLRYYSAGVSDDGYNPTANSGNGAGWGPGTTANNQPGSSGVVIVRVPAAQAAGVDPGSWVTRVDYYAEVTDGIVTDLYQEKFYGDDSVRTENGRYASPEQPDDLIPCDPSVAEGWTYADGEFTPPPPDPSWREEAIAALKQQLKDLQKDQA